ncbi:DUF3168 domain-containing protein [Caballeronia sp. dw_276]|uniref:tail completion protein gp17 n=1 Tax=Caballeronia sp. dw_276 TaxID=2719795 RepID=UPI001BD25F3B|nr:DUF3168 domain-containing protein [Caballeronia sp. dw_276]
MAESIDAIVRSALDPLVSERVFPDVAPPGTARPYMTYQAVGGDLAPTFDGVSTTVNARVQVNVWSDGRVEATALIYQAVAVLCGDDVKGVPIGGPVSTHEEDTNLYGSRLDFSIWFSA